MHFSTIYILKNEELDNISLSEIEEDFSNRFCYCCGETRPKYRYWCDWFQIGGRWAEPLVATKGLRGERSWCNTEEKKQKHHYAIVEIKDLTKDIDIEWVYAIATKSKIYEDTEDIKKWLDKINRKEINGVIAWIDCHD